MLQVEEDDSAVTSYTDDFRSAISQAKISVTTGALITEQVVRSDRFETDGNTPLTIRILVAGQVRKTSAAPVGKVTLRSAHCHFIYFGPSEEYVAATTQRQGTSTLYGGFAED